MIEKENKSATDINNKANENWINTERLQTERIVLMKTMTEQERRERIMMEAISVSEFTNNVRKNIQQIEIRRNQTKMITETMSLEKRG